MENNESKFDQQLINKITNKFAIPSVYITEVCAERVGSINSAEDNQQIVMFAQRAVSHLKIIAKVVSTACLNSPSEDEIFRVALDNRQICRFFLQSKEADIESHLNVLGKGENPSIEDFFKMIDPTFSLKEYMQNHNPWS